MGDHSMKEQITKGMILRSMKEILKKFEHSTIHTLISYTLRDMVEAEMVDPPPRNEYNSYFYHLNKKNPYLEDLLIECYSHLMIHGIIRTVPDSTNFYTMSGILNNYKLTEYGKKWISTDKEPIPEDINGYIKYLTNEIKNIDKIIIQYLSEALNTFHERHFFASAVMLGAASEKLIYLLAEAMKNSSAHSGLKDKISKLLEDRKLFTLFNKIFNELERLKKRDIPYNIHEESIDQLRSLFGAIRIQRNEAVHPIAEKIAEDQLRLLLLSFPHVCKRVYKLLNWLKQNKI